MPESAIGPNPPLRNFEIRALSGELRLAQWGEAIGAVRWADDHSSIRSQDVPGECTAKLVCDLDLFRLESIEERRAGRGPVFWLQLWPTTFGADRIIDLKISNVEARVGIEAWIESLKAMRRDRYEMIEVRFSPPNSQKFLEALKAVANPRAQLDRGAYDAAAAEARFALEALRAVAGLSEDTRKEWQIYFQRNAQDRVAAVLTELLMQVKTLTHFAHHHREHPEESSRPDYSREQASAIVRMTEEMICLVASADSGGAKPR